MEIHGQADKECFSCHGKYLGLQCFLDFDAVVTKAICLVDMFVEIRRMRILCGIP